MKLFCNFTCWTGVHGRSLVAGGLVCLGALTFIGCGKPVAKAPVKELEPPIATPSPTEPPRSPTTHVTAAPLVTPTGEVDLAELNRSLLRWVVGHRRKPASFEEFASSANTTIPPAPAGKKYWIDRTMHIVLVKQ